MSVQTVGPLNSGAAVGANGSATANASTTSIISGRVLAIMAKYSAAVAATTDVVVATTGARHPVETLLTLTNNTADVTKYPRAAVHDPNGAAVNYAATFPIYDAFPVDDYVNVNIAQANAGDNVSVYLLIEN